MAKEKMGIVNIAEIKEESIKLGVGNKSQRAKMIRYAMGVCKHVEAELIAPIYLENSLIAICVLKAKKSGDNFNEDDYNLLKTFSYQAGVAVEKARLYAEVKGYSEVLENKVKERTKEILDLQEQQRLMMHEMAHGMQTPLTILKSELSYLFDSARDKKKVMSIEKNVDRISYLIYSMLRLAKLESGQGIEKFKKFNLSELILELIEEFEITTADKNIRINHAIEPGVEFLGSPREIEELINNLVSNSVKYIGDKNDKEINIKLVKHKKEIEIRIKDNGIGVSKETKAHLFERFYRALDEKSDYIQGTGLGLIISKKIVERHSGSIELDSELGEWTEIVLRFRI